MSRVPVVVENGGSGSAIIGAAKQILDAYFSNSLGTYDIEYELTLLE